MLDCLHAAWLSLVDRFPITYKQFQDFASDCEVNEVYVDGLPAGALIVKGPEIHACILPEFKGRWLTRKELRIMNSVIEKHGYAQTSATTPEGAFFVERLGFEKHGESYRRHSKWAWKR
jgi:formylglycine-generating enzyme required for sulfatase activity